jgi:hypothetical protein
VSTEIDAAQLGREFFETYLARRPDDIARDAAQTAFSLWMNAERPWGLIEPALVDLMDSWP